MSDLPVTDAIPKVSAALYSALHSLCGTYNGGPKCYWLEADQDAPLPLLVFQSQDGGGLADPYLGIGAWRGLVTIKALAESDSQADSLLAGVPAAMQNLTVSGYGTTVTFYKPLVLPPVDGVWTAGLIYDIALVR